MVRRSIYDTRQPRQNHSKIRWYKRRPLGPASFPLWISDKSSHLILFILWMCGRSPVSFWYPHLSKYPQQNQWMLILISSKIWRNNIHVSRKKFNIIDAADFWATILIYFFLSIARYIKPGKCFSHFSLSTNSQIILTPICFDWLHVNVINQYSLWYFCDLHGFLTNCLE